MVFRKKFDPFQAFEWRLAHDRTLTLGPEGVLMGILNVTPDSFSDGGLFITPEDAIRQAAKMYAEGASMIDVGGESSRPGASEIGVAEEADRILPVIEGIAREIDVAVSVDTWRAETARAAIAAGAHVINDIWGFQRDPGIATAAAETGAGCVLMHTGRGRQKLGDTVSDQLAYLSKSLETALDAGVEASAIVLDPGFGFAKDAVENLEILANMEALFSLGQPVLTGTSRKRFIGEITGKPASERDVGTSATTVVARMKGSAIFRVHDVAINADALRVVDAIMKVSSGIAAQDGIDQDPVRQ